MRIGILRAGISGLSIAKSLSKEHGVELLEQAPIQSGIAKTRQVEGIAFHITGGHCFNCQYPDVIDFVFNELLPQQDWHKVQRNVNIKLNDHEIPYPIEYAIKQIAGFDTDMAIDITRDFLAADDDHMYGDREDWFRKKFGNTLADLYFIPYNAKIWGREPKHMSPAWVEGKLPIPDKKSFFRGLISGEEDKMSHATFYYPSTNDQNTLIDNLAKGLNIGTGYQVKKVEKRAGTWLINDEKEYDMVISTLPLNILPSLIQGTPQRILEQAKKLKYNKVTTMLWETSGTERTWTYISDAGTLFHRYIHIGNFYRPLQNYTITEAVGAKSYDEMVEKGLKDPFLIRAVDYHVSEQAYVVFDDNYAECTNAIRGHLNEINLHTFGRFGEWQYYNMDVCIKSSVDLATVIEQNKAAS